MDGNDEDRNYDDDVHKDITTYLSLHFYNLVEVFLHVSLQNVQNEVVVQNS